MGFSECWRWSIWLPHDIAVDSSDNMYIVDSGDVYEKKDICAL
ncbi:MAG TPA: hypothetical protein VFY64_11720 [Nitrososphaeraceae archaeon]|nr:hypothetical protein [Nitrososphaeraceae archaeon]